jgi:myo-inositol-1(or 4)-monophosphatase
MIDKLISFAHNNFIFSITLANFELPNPASLVIAFWPQTEVVMKDIKKTICETTLEAGKILFDNFNKIQCIEIKEGAGIVTEVDIMSEELISKRLLQALPGCSLLTEEAGEKITDSEYKWVVDPLDGTSNYAHGFPWFCVTIGLEKNGEIIAGSIYHPIMKELFYAEKGKGASLNDKPIHVSSTTNIKKSLIATGFFYDTGEQLKESVKRFEKVQQVALGVRRAGSASLDMAYTACGRFDCFWEKGLRPWDKAAGEIIFREAGGTITNFSGSKFSIYDDETLASNGHLHDQMIELLKI